MNYELSFSDQAKNDLVGLKKNDISSYKKAAKLLEEIQQHHTTGTGKPEQLKHNLPGLWSKQINKKDRLVYKIDEAGMKIEILSAEGHYSN